MRKATKLSCGSEDLVNRALARASGANIHRLGQLIAIYRWCQKDRPDIAKPFEDAIRTFSATGLLREPTPSLRLLDNQPECL